MKTILFLLMLLVLSIVPVVVAQDGENLVAFVAADSPINVRERPSTNGAILFTLPPNMSVSILDESDDGEWLMIEVADGRTGWVSASLIRVVESAIPADLIEILPENAGRLELITDFAATLSTGLAFSPDGRLLASYSWEGIIEVYDLRTKILITTLTRHSGVISDAAFSPDGSELASSGDDGTVRIWNTESWGERISFEHGTTVSAIAFHPNDREIASADTNDNLIIWDLVTGERLQEIEVRTRQVVDMAYSPDGRYLATAGDSTNSVLRVWDAETGEELWSWPSSGNLQITFSPDSQQIYLLSGDMQIRGFMLEDRELSFALSYYGGSASSIDINPAGNLVAAGGWSQGVFVIADIETSEIVFFNDSQYTNRSTSIRLTFSPDGRILATTDSVQVIRLWGVHGE